MNNQQPGQSKALSTASLVLGIIALLTGIVAVISVPAGIAAIITGIIGMKRAGKGMAIAGIVTGSIGILAGLLIGVMIVIGLSALQRNQQDVQTKNDVSSAFSAVVSFSSNNRGALPTAEDFSSGKFVNGYPKSDTDLSYVPGENCAGESDERFFNVSAKLNNGERFCLD